MKKTVRLLSYILVLAMILSSFGAFVFAEDDTGQKADAVYERQRLYEEEKSLYEKIWLNEDGTRTLEYYGTPVKYYDKDGNILDKEYRIKETADSFVYEEDFKVIFPLSLSDGVKLIFENEEGHNETLVSSRPCNLENTKRPYLSEDGRILTYEIDDNVSIEYLISDNGLKEYIVLKSYNGTEQYSSEIITNGLILEDNQLLNGEGELIAYLGEAIVFDKEERNNTIAEADTSLITEGRYLYTVTLTEDYLNSAEYPIRIDPSITLNTTGNIEDVSIVSTTTHSGTSGVLYVGRGSSGAALRALMSFPNLNIYGYHINSAIVSIRDVMCEHTYMDVECHEYTGGSWSENTTTTWSQCGTNMVGALYDSHEVYYGYGNHTGDQQRYDFDITGLANKWADGTSFPTKGLIFKAPNTYESSGSKTYKTFGSINYNSNGTYYKPALTVNYSPKFDGIYTIRNASSLYYAQASGTINGDITYQREYDYNGQYSNWLINYESGGYYTIKNLYSNKYMGVAGSSSSDGASVNIYDTISDATKWRILPTASGNYKLIAKCAESNNRVLKPQGSDWGHVLKQYAYTDDSNYLDEWALTINSYYFAFVASVDNYNFSSILSDCEGYFHNNAGMYGTGVLSTSVSDFVSNMISTSIMAVISHGTRTSFELSNNNIFTINDFNNLATNDFESLKVLLLTACYCGETGQGQNLIDSAYSKGIDCVIGFKEMIEGLEANTWTSVFLESISEGHTIDVAMADADYQVSLLPFCDVNYHTTDYWRRYTLGTTNTVVIP